MKFISFLHKLIMNDSLVYLNGAIGPLSEAKVSVMDRGFIFGDGIYEVIPVYGRKMFRSDQHITRLFRSLAAIGIPNPHTKEEWLALITPVMDAHAADDQMVYLQVTRGVAKRAHAFPSEVVPTVFIMTNPIVLPSDAVRAKGVKCVSMEDQRWLHCDIKSTSLLGNVLAAQNAVENSAMESVQFRDGYLTEAAASNVWIVKDGVLMAPPKDNLILEGIRYSLIEELCAAEKLTFKACRILRADVFDADEVLLSSATKEVLAVVQLDEQTIGKGIPGPIYKRLYKAYQAAKAAS
jgi:D-alanine transaminase